MVSSILFATDTTGFHCFYTVYTTKVSGFFISNTSLLIYELINTLEIRTSTVFKLSFPNNAKASIDSYTSHDEFGSVNNVLRDYYEMKKEIKNPKTSLEYTI